MATMAEEDLLAVFEMARSHINALRRNNNQAVMLQFYPGQRVWFHDRRGRTVRMVIDKLNDKTVGGTELLADGSRSTATWRVPPKMLRTA
jgi:hypothetical protein